MNPFSPFFAFSETAAEIIAVAVFYAIPPPERRRKKKGPPKERRTAHS